MLNPDSHVPYNNRPGVLSYSFLRPNSEKQIFFGPYDDVDAGVDVHLPLMSESEYCAGCHDASFWNVPIYKSYSEWYHSPYRENEVTCQDCHMKPNGHTTNFAYKRGGLERDPQSISQSLNGADIQITVYNLSGQMIKTLADEHFNPGQYSV